MIPTRPKPHNPPHRTPTHSTHHKTKKQRPTERAQYEGKRAVADDEKAAVRALLPGLMLSTPPLVRAQLSEALTIVSSHDFPAQWPQLLPELVERLNGALAASGEVPAAAAAADGGAASAAGGKSAASSALPIPPEHAAVINGVLATANSIFKRYRDKWRSDELVRELESSQNAFAPPCLRALDRLAADARAAAAAGDAHALRVALSSARLACRIFYSLNAPGLTPLIESQLDDWFGAFHFWMSWEEPAVAPAAAAGASATAADPKTAAAARPLLYDPDPERESPLDALKAAVCANVDLFTEVNDEEVAKYLPTFVTDVWTLLTSGAVSALPRKDNLAMAGIRLLTTVARSAHVALFGEPGVLQRVCEAVVIPNLKVREEDEELFESNPVEFIRRDAEGSDSDTRRRAAADLVRALTGRFESQVTELCAGYVNALLAEYAAATAGGGAAGATSSNGNGHGPSSSSADPDGAWRAKDCALALVMALTVRSGRPGERGATQTNPLVPVDEFFAAQVLPELTDPDPEARPLLKADALKFATTFRARLPKAQALALLPHLTRLLRSSHVVVHSYAATAVERLLTMREPVVAGGAGGAAGGAAPSGLAAALPTRPRFTPDDLAPHAQPLLEALFAAFKASPDSAENEYVMRAVVRVLALLGPGVAPVAPAALRALVGMLMDVCRNPRSPGFNHYLFEAVAALVRATAAAAGSPLALAASGAGAGGVATGAALAAQAPDPAALAAALATLEDTLFPPFDVVLQQDVQEFHPYVFQVLAQLVELSPRDRPLRPEYLLIFPPLLSPVFWERSGNVPALSRLLCAYLRRAGDGVVSGGHLPAVLGVFQKLVASKAHDHEGLALLAAAAESEGTAAALAPFSATAWQLLFLRMQNSRTPRFVRGFVALLARWLASPRQGPGSARAAMDAVQPGAYAMTLRQVLAPGVVAAAGEAGGGAAGSGGGGGAAAAPDDLRVLFVGAARALAASTPPASIFADDRAAWDALLDALGRALSAVGPDGATAEAAAAAAAAAAALDGLGGVGAGPEGDGAGGPGAGSGGDDGLAAGYSAAYARLAQAAVPELPALPEVGDARGYAAQEVAAFCSAHGVAVPAAVSAAAAGGAAAPA
jgi:exportin-2 (importin alpha re-exporter)